MPPFTIPNEASATHGDQAEFDQVDLDILTATFLQRGVKSGGTVSAHTPNNMSVDVAAGVGVYDGTEFTIVANVGLAVGAADATNPRFDLVVTDATTGVCTVVAGTASSNPVLPALPANKVALARIYIPATTSAIASGNLTACGINVSGLFGPGAAGGQTLIGGTASGEHLNLQSTRHATKGRIRFESDAQFGVFFRDTPLTDEPLLSWDSNDYEYYDRSDNIKYWHIGSVQKMALSATDLTLGVDGSAPQLILAAMDGVNEGGQIHFQGAAANTDWTFDNNAGTMRLFEGGNVKLQVRTGDAEGLTFTHSRSDTTPTGAKAYVTLNMTIAGAGGGGDFRGFNAEPIYSATADLGSGGITAFRAAGARWRSANGSPVGVVRAFLGAGIILDASSVNFTTIADVRGFEFQAVSRVTANPTGTITSGTAFRISDSTAGLYTLTTQIGLDIAALVKGATNFGIRNASNLVQTGYARFGGVTAPTDTGTGVVYVDDRLYIGNADLTTDELFYLDASTSVRPTITFDTNDFLFYDRTSNFWEWRIGGTTIMQLEGATGDLGWLGWGRVGSTVTPGNTTAGDFTFVRAFVNNDSNYSLAVVSSNPRILFDSGDLIDYVRASNYWEFQIGSAVVARLGGSDTDPFFDLQLASTPPAAPAATLIREYMRAHTAFNVPWWLDENSRGSSATLRGRSIIPKSMLPATGALTAVVLPTTTTGIVGLVYLPAGIEVDQIAYNVSAAAVGAGQVVRIAVFDERGQNILINATDAVGTNTGVRKVNVTNTYLPPGLYYLFICSQTNAATTNSTVSFLTADDTFNADASDPDIAGTLTIVGGAAAAFDPTTAITATANRTPYFRFYGTAL